MTHPAARRTFLLTGVTGFLGKVLLEELVRRRGELAIERIGVVIRPLRGLSATERFRREVARSACFGNLPAYWTQLVTVIEGNIEETGLGFGNGADGCIGEITHVVHAAASVKFDAPADVAARVNVSGTLNMLEWSRALPSLERFVYVSTAYVTPNPRGAAPIRETLAPLPTPAGRLYEDCVSGAHLDDDLLESTSHPNTYTLSKSIAEHLLVERRGDVPLAIVRPSIITTSRQHPMPGWIDSTAGVAGFVILTGTGHLRAVVCDPNARLDLIPVDEVSSRIVHACVAESEPLTIRHAVTGAASAPTVAECFDVAQRFFRTNRVGRMPDVRYLGPRGARFALADFQYHRLPIAIAGLGSRAKRRRAEKLAARVSYLNSDFAPFTARTFNFQTSVPLDYAHDGVAFFNTICRGVHRYLLARMEPDRMSQDASEHESFAGQG